MSDWIQIVGLVGSAVFAVGLVCFAQEQRRLANGVRTTGVVVRSAKKPYADEDFYHPVIEYQVGERTYQVTGVGEQSSQPYPPGQSSQPCTRLRPALEHLLEVPARHRLPAWES